MKLISTWTPARACGSRHRIAVSRVWALSAYPARPGPVSHPVPACPEGRCILEAARRESYYSRWSGVRRPGGSRAPAVLAGGHARSVCVPLRRHPLPPAPRSVLVIAGDRAGSAALRPAGSPPPGHFGSPARQPSR